jgi:hypothetical protein
VIIAAGALAAASMGVSVSRHCPASISAPTRRLRPAAYDVRTPQKSGQAPRLFCRRCGAAPGVERGRSRCLAARSPCRAVYVPLDATTTAQAAKVLGASRPWRLVERGLVDLPNAPRAPQEGRRPGPPDAHVSSGLAAVSLLLIRPDYLTGLDIGDIMNLHDQLTSERNFLDRLIHGARFTRTSVAGKVTEDLTPGFKQFALAEVARLEVEMALEGHGHLAAAIDLAPRQLTA